MVKKFILALVFVMLPISAHSVAFACMEFYYDKDGQTHKIECKYARNNPDVKCHEKGDFYWDGQGCRKIEVVENCKRQGGSWREVQLLPEPVFVNTCICSKNLMWNGKSCTNRLAPEMKRNVRKVWCDSLRKEVKVYLTSQAN